MNLSDLVAISKMSGLYRITKKRSDGLIVMSLIDNKQSFVPSRSYLFTTLDNITIYTEAEPVELRVVLQEMKKQSGTNPPVDSKADGNTLRGYLEKILPTFDREKVYNSDISKLIKWYQLLDEKGLITLEEAKQENIEAAIEEKPKAKKTKKVEETTAEETEEKPKAKKTTKKKTEE